MVVRAAEQRYVFAYARDDGQEVRRYGAERTPEVFVSTATAPWPTRAIDDDSDRRRVGALPREALDAVLEGRAPTWPETRPVGCTIKWSR